jgi:hypothetical protein
MGEFVIKLLGIGIIPDWPNNNDFVILSTTITTGFLLCHITSLGNVFVDKSLI